MIPATASLNRISSSASTASVRRSLRCASSESIARQVVLVRIEAVLADSGDRLADRGGARPEVPGRLELAVLVEGDDRIALEQRLAGHGFPGLGDEAGHARLERRAFERGPGAGRERQDEAEGGDEADEGGQVARWAHASTLLHGRRAGGNMGSRARPARRGRGELTVALPDFIRLE